MMEMCWKLHRKRQKLESLDSKGGNSAAKLAETNQTNTMKENQQSDFGVQQS